MTESPRVVCRREQDLDFASFRDVLVASGLGETRPVDDPQRLRDMLSGASLIVTARLDGPQGRLVGVARALTDFAWCCYLAELAVDRASQGLGVGRLLMEEVRSQIGPRASLVLASMPDAVGFYERIGMAPMKDAFWWKRKE